MKKAKRGAIAKAISIFENDEKESRKLIKKIFKASGKSVVIGITGPAGAGKSSLIDKTSIKLKLFPNYVTLKAIISLDNYNNIINDDFIITTNYKLLNSNFSNLSLLLAKYPKEVKNINWHPKTVNYLMRK